MGQQLCGPPTNRQIQGWVVSFLIFILVSPVCLSEGNDVWCVSVPGNEWMNHDIRNFLRKKVGKREKSKKGGIGKSLFPFFSLVEEREKENFFSSPFSFPFSPTWSVCHCVFTLKLSSSPLSSSPLRWQIMPKLEEELVCLCLHSTTTTAAEFPPVAAAVVSKAAA